MIMESCDNQIIDFADFSELTEKSHVCDSKPKLLTFCLQHWHEVRSIGDSQSVNFMKFPDFLVNFQIP